MPLAFLHWSLFVIRDFQRTNRSISQFFQMDTHVLSDSFPLFLQLMKHSSHSTISVEI